MAISPFYKKEKKEVTPFYGAKEAKKAFLECTSTPGGAQIWIKKSA